MVTNIYDIDTAYGQFRKPTLQSLRDDMLSQAKVELSVLRLDAIHPVVSGNKLYKLRYYLQEARDSGYTTIVTKGGLYSNHLVATAYACKLAGFKSVGIVRAHPGARLTSTMKQCMELGMQLEFAGREDFRGSYLHRRDQQIYEIDLGGYGTPGVKGAAGIYDLIENAEGFTHIVCAVGTGTTLAGIATKANSHQKVIGISVMKQNLSLQAEIEAVLGSSTARFAIEHGFDFGGFAKHNQELLNFMNQVFTKHLLPTDKVYTAKALYATWQMIRRGAIAEGSNVIMIHTGGLQGNSSLPKGSIIFE